MILKFKSLLNCLFIYCSLMEFSKILSPTSAHLSGNSGKLYEIIYLYTIKMATSQIDFHTFIILVDCFLVYLFGWINCSIFYLLFIWSLFSLRNGSIIVDAGVEYDKVSSPSATDLAKALADGVRNGLVKLSIDTQTIQVTDSTGFTGQYTFIDTSFHVMTRTYSLWWV